MTIMFIIFGTVIGLLLISNILLQIEIVGFYEKAIEAEDKHKSGLWYFKRLW